MWDSLLQRYIFCVKHSIFKPFFVLLPVHFNDVFLILSKETTKKYGIMETKPFILISNDDGYHSNGIHKLVDFVSGLGDVLVCAPESALLATSVEWVKKISRSWLASG